MCPRIHRFARAIGALLCSIILFPPLIATAGTAPPAAIQAAIAAAGHRWIAGETPISKLPPRERYRRLGLTRPEWMGWGSTEPPMPEGPLPDHVTWSPYVTPVRDQGACGSCWAFATAAALESNVLIHDERRNQADDRAEQILLGCSGAGSCDGGYIDEASEFIRATGLPPEAFFPYTVTGADDRCSNAQAGWQDRTRKAARWWYVSAGKPSLESIKAALTTYGPLVTTMEVYTDFYYYTAGIYSHASGDIEGGHAVLIVGYTDDASVAGGGYFTVKNSWGTSWGEHGFFRIAYNQMTSAVQFGAWTLGYGEPARLTVASQHPDRGVLVRVNPIDDTSHGDGTTPFTRTYPPGIPVTLTAPGAAGGYAFQEWRVDGVKTTVKRALKITADTDRTITAVYSDTRAYVLTVTTEGAGGWTAIGVSLPDLDGARNGTAPLTRTYAEGTSVALTAPEVIGKTLFQKWTLDGADAGTERTLTIAPTADHALIAHYAPAPPFRIAARMPNPNRPPASYRFVPAYNLQPRERLTGPPEWSLDGHGVATEPILRHTFTAPGDYQVTARAETNQGRTLQDHVQVHVAENQKPSGTVNCTTGVVRTTTGPNWALRCRVVGLKDPDGRIRSITWQLPELGYETTAGSFLRYRFTSPRLVRVVAEVTDNSGDTTVLETLVDLTQAK